MFKGLFPAITLVKNRIKQFLLITVSKSEVIEGQYLQESLFLVHVKAHHIEIWNQWPSKNDPQEHCAIFFPKYDNFSN